MNTAQVSQRLRAVSTRPTSGKRPFCIRQATGTWKCKHCRPARQATLLCCVGPLFCRIAWARMFPNFMEMYEYSKYLETTRHSGQSEKRWIESAIALVTEFSPYRVSGRVHSASQSLPLDDVTPLEKCCESQYDQAQSSTFLFWARDPVQGPVPLSPRHNKFRNFINIICFLYPRKAAPTLFAHTVLQIHRGLILCQVNLNAVRFELYSVGRT